MVFRRKRHSRKRGFFRSRRHSSRRGSSSSSGMMNLVYGAGYGALRQKLANLVQPLTDKIPLGNYADNVVMGLIALGAKKYTRNPTVHKVADAALYIEGALIGSEAVQGISSTTGTTTGKLW